MRSRSTANDSASGRVLSTVKILALVIIRSAAGLLWARADRDNSTEIMHSNARGESIRRRISLCVIFKSQKESRFEILTYFQASIVTQYSSAQALNSLQKLV